MGDTSPSSAQRLPLVLFLVVTPGGHSCFPPSSYVRALSISRFPNLLFCSHLAFWCGVEVSSHLGVWETVVLEPKGLLCAKFVLQSLMCTSGLMECQF